VYLLGVNFCVIIKFYFVINFWDHSKRITICRGLVHLKESVSIFDLKNPFEIKSYVDKPFWLRKRPIKAQHINLGINFQLSQKLRC